MLAVQGYWMSAIAARPSSTHKGYLLGGLVWFAVPFSLATSLGLGALALDLPITAAEVAKGLVPPATATALMGKSGSVLLLTMLFMAVTSAGSAELVAISSLCTYDIYRTYINPDASGEQILRVSRALCAPACVWEGVFYKWFTRRGQDGAGLGRAAPDRGERGLHHDCVPAVAHRNLKPSNILLDTDMEERVADFGVAKALHGAAPM